MTCTIQVQAMGDSFNQLIQGNDFSHGGGECIVFCHHGRQSYGLLEFTAPNDRAIGNADNIPSPAFDASGVRSVFSTVESTEVSIHIAVNFEKLSSIWGKDKAFIPST
jgi:hypothetical protein